MAHEFVRSEFDEPLQPLAPRITSLAERDRRLRDGRNQRRRRRRKDECATTIDQEVREWARRTDECARRAESLPAGMDGDDVFAAFQKRGAAPALRSEDAGCMRFVNDKHRLPVTPQLVKFREIRPIPVHTVKTLHRDPNSPHPSGRAPLEDSIIDGLQIIVTRRGNFSTAAAHPGVDACVNPLVVNHEIPALWRRCKQGLICSIAATEIQR